MDNWQQAWMLKMHVETPKFCILFNAVELRHAAFECRLLCVRKDAIYFECKYMIFALSINGKKNSVLFALSANSDDIHSVKNKRNMQFVLKSKISG